MGWEEREYGVIVLCGDVLFSVVSYWIGLDWIVLYCIVLDCIVLDYIGLDWVESATSLSTLSASY
jgi:hypothetical protein